MTSDRTFSAAEAIAAHYASGYEVERLAQGTSQLERERSRELLRRLLPPPPATILDIGGGPGASACWLAKEGYRVHLIDITPLHVQLACEASARQPEAPLASVEVGDARTLSFPADSADAVILFGPLYHLTERADRVQALREAHRVVRTGGVVIVAAISRFASALDGVSRGFLKDPHFDEIVRRDLTDGHHQNPTGRPEYFMDTFFHHPEELRAEVADVGFSHATIYGVEGPGWLLPDFDAWWQDAACREPLMYFGRTLETEQSLLGLSAHLIAVARREC
jgi:ubiquinone/menaquinone biosynthesis C-methylase UbiE